MTSQEAPPPTMSSSPPPPTHVLLVSAPLQGHVSPLLVLGRRLASAGLLVTFTTAPHAGLKLKHRHGEVDGGVGRGALRFEHLRGEELWAPEDRRYRVADDVARHLDDAAPAALAGLIRRQADAGRPVSCVVANAFAPWALRAAGATGVPGAMLWTQSCAVLSLYYHYFHSLAAFPSKEAGPDAPVDLIPGLPTLAAGDLPALIHAPEEFVWRQALLSDIASLRGTVSWVLVNTFDELEHAAIEALGAHLPVVFPVGPLFETENDGGGVDECTAWLDARPPRSVVFVAFGSLVKLGRDEMAEVAAGLATTGRPFLWVVRDDNRDLLPPGTAASSGGNGGGKVVPWCEQRRVLLHRAVGCFVTHCGWNSTTEALAAGVPVVTYPALSDQRTNAAFLVDVCGVGVRLPTPPTRDDLRQCVEAAMRGTLDLDGEGMRARAEGWKAKASAAVAEDGSSYRATWDFVDAVSSLSIGAGNSGN